MSLNPYESPTVASMTGGRALSLGGVWVDGKNLVVPPDAVLPLRCIKTNQPITEDDKITKQFTWCPRWVIVVFLLSRIIGIICYVFARHKFKLTYGLHPEVRRKHRNRLIIAALMMVAFIVAMPVLGVALNSDMAVFVCIGGMIVSLVALLAMMGHLTVRKHKEGAYWMSGCCAEFLAAIPEEAALEKERFKQKGARQCPHCGITMIPPQGTPWGHRGYCSRGCLVAVEGEQAANTMPADGPLTPALGNNVHLQCSSGHAFRVPASFSGTSRPCPVCGEKTRVP